jgi:5-methyltetrahydropteroyltriglutamate--homocysteine methyltransferase
MQRSEVGIASSKKAVVGVAGPAERHHDPRRVCPKGQTQADTADGYRSHMKRSSDRILTTHTGSLPRTAKVIELLLAEQQKRGARKAELNAAVREAIAHVVQKQIESGIDVISDGEQVRTDYTVHVLDRFGGFAGDSSPPLGTGDPEFPELAQLLTHFASPFQYRPCCTGEVTWKDWTAAQADIDLSKDVMNGANATELFMTSPSPGQIARYLKNKHYETEEAYVYALADVMEREYRAIVDAGFILQLDCPDLAMLRHTVYLDMSLSDFRKIIAVNVAALNRAVADIPADRMRMHVCWGSTVAPHHTDVPLIDIIDIVLSAKPMAVSFPAANARHEHEWKIWRQVKLPAGKVIVPGVIDSTVNTVEHPEVVADRILNFANVVGRDNVIAGVDCGFGTFAGRVQVDTKIVWLKLQSLAEGARRASAQLWAKVP